MTGGQRFAGARILLTGASDGIIAATARQIAAEGGSVVAVARKAEALATLAATLPGQNHTTLALDATDEAAVKATLAAASETIGRLDGAVLGVGGHMLRPARMMGSEQYLTLFRQNVLSATNFIPYLVRALNPGSGIVLLSSAARLRGGATVVGYATAKEALLGLVRSLACELAPKVRVNSVSPGVVKTVSSDRFLATIGAKAAEEVARRHLLGVGEPEQVAAAIAFLLSREASWITGTDLAVDGGFAVQA